MLRTFSSYFTVRESTFIKLLFSFCAVISGVPLGSILGPIHVSLCIKSLSAYMHSHSIMHQSYDDEFQLQISKLLRNVEMSTLLHSMQSCIYDIMS